MMGWARVRWLIVIFSLSGVLDTAAGLPRNAAPNATLLSHLLLERYSPLVPPISPDGKPVAVELDMTLLEISEVSTTGEYIQLHVWWRLFWKDPRLSWEEEYGVSSLRFEKHHIWVPDVFVYEQIEVEDQPTTAVVYPDGSAYVSIPRVMKIGCPMKLVAFPHDTQFCNFTAGSWNLDGLAMDFLPRAVDPASAFEESDTAASRNIIDLDSYNPLQSWDLTAIRSIWDNQYYPCCPHVPFPVVKVQLELKRATATYLGGMVWPLIIVTAIGLFSLWMPAPTSGARPALSVTILLTTATVYFVASRATPHSNVSTSIGRLYLFCLGMSVVLVLLSILTTGLNLIHPEDEISSRHILHYFRFFDKSQTGTLSGEELGNALNSLGLTEGEKAVIQEHFGTGGDGEVSLEQWKAFGELAKKDDDIAIYHNSLVQYMVMKKIESDLKAHGHSLGKSFDPTDASVTPKWKQKLSVAMDTIRRKSSIISHTGTRNAVRKASSEVRSLGSGEGGARAVSVADAMASIHSPAPGSRAGSRRLTPTHPTHTDGCWYFNGDDENDRHRTPGSAGNVGVYATVGLLGDAEGGGGGAMSEQRGEMIRAGHEHVLQHSSRSMMDEVRLDSVEAGASELEQVPMTRASYESMRLAHVNGSNGSNGSNGLTNGNNNGNSNGLDSNGLDSNVNGNSSSLNGAKDKASRREEELRFSPGDVRFAAGGGGERRVSVGGGVAFVAGTRSTQRPRARRDEGANSRGAGGEGERIGGFRGEKLRKLSVTPSAEGSEEDGVHSSWNSFYQLQEMGKAMKEKIKLARRNKLGSNQTFKSASRKIGQMLDPHRQVQTSAQKEGRYVAALLDRYARRLLPVLLLVYLLMEFLGVWSGTNSLSFEEIGYTSPSGARKVLIEFQDRRSGEPGEVLCYRSFPRTLRFRDEFRHSSCSAN